MTGISEAAALVPLAAECSYPLAHVSRFTEDLPSDFVQG